MAYLGVESADDRDGDPDAPDGDGDADRHLVADASTPTVTATATPTPDADADPGRRDTDPTPTPPEHDPVGPGRLDACTEPDHQQPLTNGLANRYYYKCTFTGGIPTAVLRFQGTSYNLTFDSCTIATGGGWNGVTINDANGRIHDITFKSCLFKSQTRMGFECTSRPTTATTQYDSINILDSTFEPQGNEAVSYDGGYAAGYSTFVGNDPGRRQRPGSGLRAGLRDQRRQPHDRDRQPHLPVPRPQLNLQMHVTTRCGWVFSNNVFDASKRLQATPMAPTPSSF